MYLIPYAQTITGIEYSINWSAVKTCLPVAGKGIYILANEGLLLLDPATAKYQLYNETDSNKTIPGIIGVANYKDKVVIYTSTKVYRLLANGKFKDITPPYDFRGYDAIRHVAMDENEITVTNGMKLLSYRNDVWKQVPLPDMRYSKLTKAFPAGGKYLGNIENASSLFIYNADTKSQSYVANAFNPSGLYVPGQSVWTMSALEMYYTSATAKKIRGYFKAETFPYKLKWDMFDKANTFRNCKLALSDKQDIFFINEDIVLQVDTKAINDSEVNIIFKPTTLKPTYASPGTEMCVYGNSIYKINPNGVIAVSPQKTDTLFKAINRSSNIEGSNRMMPNGFLYTKQSNNSIYWNNGKDRSGSTFVHGFVLDMATDGKSNYVLTEKILYREKSIGVFDSIAPAGENKMNALAIDKAGTIWMASYKGITTISKGVTTFIPAASIEGFPANEALNAIAISPVGEMYVSLSKVYIYKDKKMTLIPGSPSLIYRHYFDGKGNDYMSSNGKTYFYNGKEVRNLEDILKEAYPEKNNAYITAATVDEQGRCWAIVSFRQQKAIVVFDKGKPVNYFADDKIPVDPTHQKIFCYKQQMIIATEKAGWTIVKFK